MSKSTIGLRRSGLAAIATTSLVMGAIFAGAGVANADANFEFTRVNGQTRYDVSANAAGLYGKADHVILASGESGKFGDALTANFLAGSLGAPVLLTQLDETPAAVKKAIADAGATKITIVGGELSISKEQEDALAKDYTVDRISGTTRYDVAADIINEGTEKSDTAIIATGEKFADALAGGPVSYAAGMPLAIVQRDEVPAAVMQALKDAKITKAVVLGGDLSVSVEVRDQLKEAGITLVEEFKGADRAQVATMVADYAIKNHGFTNTRVNAATGREFSEGADALSAGPVSGKEKRAILVTAGDPKAGTQAAVGEHLLNWLEANAKTLTGTDNHLFGGPLSITDAMKDAMETAAQTVTSNQSYTVTPQAATTVNTNANNGDTKVTFSGISASQVYLRLIDCKQDSADQAGQVSFTDTTPNDDKADLGAATNATITQINGVSSNYGTGADKVDVQNGTVTVTVNSNSAGCSQLVAFEDKNSDGALNLDSNNKPTEPFAVSGALTAVTPAGIKIQGGEATSTPYGSYTATAQLTDGANGTGDAVAIAGVPVKFSRTLPDGSTVVTTVNTDAKGQASYTFSASDPNATAGDTTQETVTATADLDQNGKFDDGDTASQVVTFSDAAAAPANAAVTSPADGTNVVVGSPVTVTAKVTDQYGGPVSGAKVDFSTVTGFSGTRTTGTDGTASFTYKYSGTTPKDDTVTVSVEGMDATGTSTVSMTDNETSYADNSVTVHWEDGVATVNGDTYTSIADAVAEAQPGDTITAAGTFKPAADILINKDVTVDGGGTAVINGDGGFQVSASGATIKGFKITVPSNNQGVEVQNSVNDVTISGNTITGNGTDSATGVFLNQTTGTVVSNNTISKVISGIGTDTNGTVTITGNTISNTISNTATSGEGIGVGGANVAISGNTFKNEDTHVRLYVNTTTSYLPGVLSSNTFDSAKLYDSNNDGDYADSGDAIITPAP